MSVLPPHLTERTRRIGTRSENVAGRFVLYWMRTAVRGLAGGRQGEAPWRARHKPPRWGGCV